MRRRKSDTARLPVALSCSECGTRNYKTTRSRTAVGQLSLKKFCPVCNRHTTHVDSK